MCERVWTLPHPRFSDRAGAPASLSRRNIGEIRGTIGFEGPVLTDDMQMHAVSSRISTGRAAIAAVNAGNSLQIYANHRGADPIETVRAVGSTLRWAGPGVDQALAAQQVERVVAFRSRLI